MAQVPSATSTEISSNGTSSWNNSAEVHSAQRIHGGDPNSGPHGANSISDTTCRQTSTYNKACSLQDENPAGPYHGLLTKDKSKSQPDAPSKFFRYLSSMFQSMWSTSWLHVVVVFFGLASLTALMIFLSSSIEITQSVQAEEEDPGLAEMNPTVALLRSRGVEPFKNTLDNLDRRRCGRMWQEDYSQLHASMVHELAARSLESPDSHELFAASHTSKSLSNFSASPSNMTNSKQACRGQLCRPDIKILLHGIQKGLADSLFGLMSLLLYAMVTRRALFVQNKCLNLAFEPVGFDWRLQTGEALEVAGSNVAFDVTGVSLVWKYPIAEVRKKLKTVEHSTIANVSSNRGFLVETLGKRGSPLPGGLHPINVRPENLFGCFMHYMMRLKPEIQKKAAKELKWMKIAEQRNLICMHARFNDKAFQDMKGDSKANRRQYELQMKVVKQMVECAKRIEAMIGSNRNDKFFFASSSNNVKRMVQRRYKGKVVVSRIEPSHLKFPKGGEEWERRSCQQTITEWSILSRCTQIVLIKLNTGFAKSAAFYGFHETNMYESTKCNPPRPWSINTLASTLTRV